MSGITVGTGSAALPWWGSNGWTWTLWGKPTWRQWRRREQQTRREHLECRVHEGHRRCPQTPLASLCSPATTGGHSKHPVLQGWGQFHFKSVNTGSKLTSQCLLPDLAELKWNWPQSWLLTKARSLTWVKVRSSMKEMEKWAREVGWRSDKETRVHSFLFYTPPLRLF